MVACGAIQWARPEGSSLWEEEEVVCLFVYLFICLFVYWTDYLPIGAWPALDVFFFFFFCIFFEGEKVLSVDWSALFCSVGRTVLGQRRGGGFHVGGVALLVGMGETH